MKTMKKPQKSVLKKNENPILPVDSEIGGPKDLNIAVLKMFLDYIYDLPEMSRSKNKLWRFFKSYMKGKGNWKDRNRGVDKPSPTLNVVSSVPPIPEGIDPDEIW
jgi:hypothetical protein